MMDETVEVDKLTAYEFIREVYKEIPQQWLYKIDQPMIIKSQLFQQLLAKENILQMDAMSVKKLVKKVFSMKKKSRKWKEEDFLVLRKPIYNLIHGEEDLKLRFNNFCHLLISQYSVGNPFDFASELLFHYNPSEYWLWTNWMYDPAKNTGALPLVLAKRSLNQLTTYGNQYMEIGRAIKLLEETATEIGIREPNSEPSSVYEISIFLAATYSVYAYTMAKVSYTKEFTAIMPKMAEFMLRVLGIYDSNLIEDNEVKE